MPDIDTPFKPMMAMTCPKCGWEWNYKGYKQLERTPSLVTCPGCGRKVPTKSDEHRKR